MHPFKKTFFSLVALLLVFSFQISFALADLGLGIDFGGDSGSIKGMPSPTEATNSILDMLGFKIDAIKNMAEQFNVMSNKNDGPNVDLTFAPTPSLIPGQKATALATPGYFANNPKNMYYTWALKTAKCTKDPGSCDYNHSGGKNPYDIEDQKIEAARIQAAGNFNWQEALGKDDPNCSSSFPPAHCSLPSIYETTTFPKPDDGFKAIVGGTDQAGKNMECFVHGIRSGVDIKMLEGCSNDVKDILKSHLFPDTSKMGFIVGDGKLTAKEAEFWRIDPRLNDTSGSGQTDEATIAGLGKMNFSWTYSPGDKLGVAVEGVSVDPTKQEDSSYKTMWAISGNPGAKTSGDSGSGDDRLVYSFSKPGSSYCGGGACTVTVTCGSTVKTHNIPNASARYEEGAGGASFLWKPTSENPPPHLVVLISGDHDESCTVCVTGGECGKFVGRMSEGAEASASVDDLNKAFGDSGLIDPTDNANTKVIENNLAVDNANPQFDATGEGENSDTITFTSNATNNDTRNYTNYSWSMAVATTQDSSDWKTISKTALTGENIALDGIGLNKLRLPLKSLRDVSTVKSADKTFYLRINLKTKENAGGFAKEGAETIMVPVQVSKGKIVLKSSAGTTICSTGAELYSCPVVKNEIVSASLSQYAASKYTFYWTLNEKRLPDSGNTILFPVTAELGNALTLRVDVSNTDTTVAEKTSFSRSFSVTEPAVTTQLTDTESDSIAPVLLGYHVEEYKGQAIDPATKQPTIQKWPDYSKDLFQAVQGKAIQLKAAANTSYAQTGKVTWVVDGVPIEADKTDAASGAYLSDNNTVLNLPIVKAVGESYKVTSIVPYKQDAASTQKLYDKWGISSSVVATADVVKTVTITASDNLNGKAVALDTKKQNKVLASLFSGLPDYIIFLFKIIITSALILFSSGLVMNLSPERKEY